jgi:hypothetical protein
MRTPRAAAAGRAVFPDAAQRQGAAENEANASRQASTRQT